MKGEKARVKGYECGKRVHRWGAMGAKAGAKWQVDQRGQGQRVQRLRVKGAKTGVKGYELGKRVQRLGAMAAKAGDKGPS